MNGVDDLGFGKRHKSAAPGYGLVSFALGWAKLLKSLSFVKKLSIQPSYISRGCQFLLQRRRTVPLYPSEILLLVDTSEPISSKKSNQSSKIGDWFDR
jgi:hypothetical protein